MRKLKVKLPYKSLEDIYLKESFARHIPLLPRQAILGEAETNATSGPAIPAKQVLNDYNNTSALPAVPGSEVRKPVATSERKKKEKKSAVSLACKNVDMSEINLSLEPSKEFKAIAGKPIFEYKWTDFQRSLFNNVKPGVKRGTGGTGRGEYSVASFVTGITTQNSTLAQEEINCLLDSCISGQGKSYDVCVPPELPEYEGKQRVKFEVKQLNMDGSSVMIGAEGTTATHKIVEGVMNIIIRLEDSYKSLSETDKNFLDSSLRKELGLEQENNTWTLGGFIAAIYQKEDVRAIREIPSNLIKKDGKILYPKLFKIPLRAKYFYRTLQEVFNAIEKIAKTQNQDITPSSSKIDELKNIVRKLYLPELQDSDQRRKEEEHLDRELDKLDRALTRRKILTGGKGHLSYTDFLSSMNKLKLLSSLREVQNMFNDPEIIRSLFPKEFDGLFLVQADSFSYIPHDQIFNYIEIDSISNGGAKIAFKKTK